MKKLRDILERKIKFLHHELFYGYGKDNSFDSLLMDYLFFIGNTPEIAPIVRKLALNGQIHREFLYAICIVYMLKGFLRDKKMNPPAFYSADIEKRFSILEEVRLAAEEHQKDKDMGYKKGVPELEIINEPNEKRENYFRAKKLFLNILEEIDLEDLRKQTKTHEQLAEPANFNEGKSLLSFEKHQVLISRNCDSDPHYLLCILFSDKSKKWAYDEIWEHPYFSSKNTEYIPATDWQKIYQAGYSINEKVAKNTTIKDFLSLTKKDIAINKKYL